MAVDTRIALFRLDESNTVWIEVPEVPVDADEGDIRRTARPGAEHERRFQEAVEQIRPAAVAVFDALREINTPKQIELEFGIGFSGKVGAFIASADASATFKAKLTWENAPPKPAPSR